jgi:hypothetical protein
MVLLSWAGKTPNEIAAELDCHPQTVRIHLGRFTAEGVAGLLVRSGSGRKPRLTEQERSRILALVKQAPPGHLETQADGTMVAPDEGGRLMDAQCAGPGRQRSWDPGQTQPDSAYLSARRRALASHP